MLVPGVRPSGGVNNVVIDQISTVSYSINGQRANSNEFLLDGAPNSAASQNQPVINANPDMVQEFKVETNGYSAEFGRAAGGVFSVVTRSGSNNVHFTLYEFFRNDKLNANDFFANATGKPKPISSSINSAAPSAGRSSSRSFMTAGIALSSSSAPRLYGSSRASRSPARCRGPINSPVTSAISGTRRAISSRFTIH